MAWKTTVRIYLLVLAVSIFIAIGFALMGLWLIIPFTGLEMALLAVGLYLCALRTQNYELIAVDEQHIKIERKHHAPGECVCFQRYWAQIKLVPPIYRNQPSRLLIQSYGRSEEIGSLLNEEEKTSLAQELDRLLTFPS